MFDFGKDLKRFVADGVGGKGRDPRVLELLPTAVMAEQAAAESTLAAQANEPWRAWRDVALIWISHARRTGLTTSLEAADRAARRSLEAANAGSPFVLASVAMAEVLLSRFDLRSDLAALAEAEAVTETAADEPRSRKAQAAVASIHARLRARRALISDQAGAVRAAAALMDAALHLEGRGANDDAWSAVRIAEVRLERADLSVRSGLRWEDTRLLEQAGRELRAIMETVDADLLPVTRARAMRSCGQALSALGDMAGDPSVMEQAVEILAAGCELFDTDHSPLDMAALIAARAEAMVHWQAGDPVLELLCAAEDQLEAAWRISATRSNVLEIEIRLAAAAIKTLKAASQGDVASLSQQESRLRQRIARAAARSDGVTWAVDQLALANVYDSLDELGCSPTRGWAASYARSEAREVLRESGLSASL